MVSVRQGVRGRLAKVPGALAVARLVMGTVRVCLRYRVTGLASEAGFFALLSMPPLVLGLFGGVGYVGKLLGPDTVQQVGQAVETYAARFLTDDSVRKVIVPTVGDVLGHGRFDVLSFGFLLSLWSGSRALNVFVDTVSIMYGQSGVRGIVRTRALSFSLYLVSLVVGIVVLPLVLIGPSLLARLLPDRLALLAQLYWPAVVLLTVASLTMLFHISTPRRTPWRRDVPGAAVALVIWLVTSFFLRVSLDASIGGTSIYGPLAAPIVVLIWLYFLAIGVLIGAAVNAASLTLWPVQAGEGARARLFAWARTEVASRRAPRHERPLTPMPPGVLETPSEQPPDGAADDPDGAPDDPDGSPGRLDAPSDDRLLSARTPRG